MTEQEEKEIELFATWWDTDPTLYTDDYEKGIAEEAWFARAKLDNSKPTWNTAPKWANYLTQDSNGRWAWWENKPTLIEIPSLTLIYYWDGLPGEVEYIGNHNLSKEVYEKENL